MDFVSASKALFSLLFVLLLVVLIGYLFRKFGEKSFMSANKMNFKMNSIIPLDTKRRVVNFDLDSARYTVLLGNNDILLDKKDVKKSK